MHICSGLFRLRSQNKKTTSLWSGRENCQSRSACIIITMPGRQKFTTYRKNFYALGTIDDGYKGKPSTHKNLKSCICFSRILVVIMKWQLIYYEKELYILQLSIMYSMLILKTQPVQIHFTSLCSMFKMVISRSGWTWKLLKNPDSEHLKCQNRLFSHVPYPEILFSSLNKSKEL